MSLEKEKEVMRRIQKSPIEFIRLMWKLKPERDNDKFIKGQHITWQQHDILLAVEEAIKKEKPSRISVASGHGIGKSTTLAWLVIWYLFTHKDAQVPCTAPTSDQMYDVLWKEIAKWIGKLPEPIQKKFDWSTGYLRITERPNVWFARAKTARKEAPEALAGVHGDYVMAIVDEASGVPDEIFNTAEGSLTGENVLVILISNPTRLNGYFYDSHHKDKENWQALQFSSIDSPIVDKQFNERIVAKHGQDSDEYKIRVLGQFPAEDSMDDKGFVPLLAQADLKFTNLEEFVGRKWLGVDPSGEGSNKTVWVLRDNFRAKIVAQEDISDAKGIAEKTMTLMTRFDVNESYIVVDNFGVGANVGTELAYVGVKVNCINVGTKSNDNQFINLRAEAYWKLREWIKTGGELIGVDKWEELLRIKFKRDLSGKIKIMSKDEMRREGIQSPDKADALMLTFAISSAYSQQDYQDIQALEELSYNESY